MLLGPFHRPGASQRQPSSIWRRHRVPCTLLQGQREEVPAVLPPHNSTHDHHANSNTCRSNTAMACRCRAALGHDALFEKQRRSDRQLSSWPRPSRRASHGGVIAAACRPHCIHSRYSIVWRWQKPLARRRLVAAKPLRARGNHQPIPKHRRLPRDHRGRSCKRSAFARSPSCSESRSGVVTLGSDRISRVFAVFLFQHPSA